MKSRLFLQIFGTYLFLILLTTLVVGLFVGQHIRGVLEDRIEEDLLTYARLIETGSSGGLKANLKTLAEISGSRITIIDAKGTVIADSEIVPPGTESHLNRPEIQEARVKGSGRSIRLSRTQNIDVMYAAIQSKTAIPGGYIRLGRPLNVIGESVRDLNRSLLTSILILGIISILIAVIFAYRLAMPIKEMELFTEKLREGQAPGSLFIKGGSETQKLARNINYLVEELESRIRAANEEKGKVYAAFASMVEGVLVLDSRNHVETCNRAFSKMIGTRFGDIRDKTLMEAFRNIELQNAFDRFESTGEPLSREIHAGSTDPKILHVSISSIEGLPHEDRKTMLVFHDITMLKKLERMRADFVASVTHEIKTPLTAILGFIETLQEGAIEDRETARKFLEVIGRQAKRLNRLIDDLLVISNIELGEMKFYFEVLSLGEPLNTALSIIEIKAREKEIDISKDLPENLPLIRGDRDRLVQIFLNILDNAVKFNPRGGRIDIKAAERGGEVEVRISDSGPGIPQGEIPRLGERFYRVDKTRSRELGGTGLGLSIVKHLLIAQEGRMEIESRLGYGTTVILYFPMYKDISV